MLVGAHMLVGLWAHKQAHKLVGPYKGATSKRRTS